MRIARRFAATLTMLGASWPRLLPGDNRGVAALEFALLGPFLITLVLGLAALTQGMRANTLLTSTAHNMANIVASQTAVTGGNGGTLHDICSGVQLTMLPYDLSRLSVSVASYTVHTGAVVKDWEYDMASTAGAACQAGGTALGSAGQATATSFLTPIVTVTTGLPPVTVTGPGPLVEGDSVIVARANYGFLGFTTSVLPSISVGVPDMPLSQIEPQRDRGLVSVTTNPVTGAVTSYSGSIVCTSGC